MNQSTDLITNGTTELAIELTTDKFTKKHGGNH